MTHFGFKEAGRPALQNPFFRVEMQDAIMSINTRDEILVHCRVLLPLFLLLSVLSVFPDSSPVPFIPLGGARQRKDNRIAVNRDSYSSSNSCVLTDFQGDLWSLENFCLSIAFFHFSHSTIPSMESSKEFDLKSTHLFTLKVVESLKDLRNLSAT